MKFFHFIMAVSVSAGRGKKKKVKPTAGAEPTTLSDRWMDGWTEIPITDVQQAAQADCTYDTNLV